MSNEILFPRKKDEIDCKITKKHYPRTNESCLEFVFERDPNNFMLKNKILIKGSIEVDKRLVPENGFAHKLFSKMKVNLNSQEVHCDQQR